MNGITEGHEIAEIIGVPRGTVKSRVHRARKLIKDLHPDA